VPPALSYLNGDAAFESKKRTTSAKPPQGA